MAKVDRTAGELACRIVLCGPPASGKTENLQYLSRRLDPASRGRLISPAGGDDSSFFFDFLAVELGDFHGLRTHLHLYAIPGGEGNEEARRRILRGADGLIFVADSRADRRASNGEALNRVRADLERAEREDEPLSVGLQYNKRDLSDILSVETLEEDLNPEGAPFFEAVATVGRGVIETVSAVGAAVIRSRPSLAEG